LLIINVVLHVGRSRHPVALS